MKKAVLIVICVLALLLCGCQTKEQNDMNNSDNKTVTFINGVNDADVWILPQTKANLKTTVWGKATASKVQKGESRQTPLCEAGDEGHYIFRMIDTDSFYYSANDLTLEAGWTLELKESDSREVTLEIKDKNGGLKNTYEVFSAKL